MDDLYSNLENYNEVNALEELRSENKDLKVKLEEYSTAMDKLQKDFDQLVSEFKKLEFNYSSLLKTARAEIERKTQIITNINIEKDMLVLNSIQNGNRNILRRNIMINKQQPHKKEWKDKEPDSKCKDNTKEIQDNQNLKNKSFAKEWKEKEPDIKCIDNTKETQDNPNLINKSFRKESKEKELVSKCKDNTKKTQDTQNFKNKHFMKERKEKETDIKCKDSIKEIQDNPNLNNKPFMKEKEPDIKCKDNTKEIQDNQNLKIKPFMNEWKEKEPESKCKDNTKEIQDNQNLINKPFMIERKDKEPVNRCKDHTKESQENQNLKMITFLKEWKYQEPESKCKDNTEELQDNLNLKKFSTTSGKMEDSQSSSEDKITGSTKKLTNTVNQTISDVDPCSDRNSESKENMHHAEVQNVKEDVKTWTLNIKNRRKSMPAASTLYDQFSSDEECNSPVPEVEKKRYSSRDTTDRKILEKNYNDIYSTKISESSSMDDKTSSYHESSRESYKRSSKYYSSEKYRSRDKYDSSLRYRKRFSPDRSHPKSSREYLDDRYQQANYGRLRVLQSPPNEKFQHYHRNNRNYRPRYEGSQPYEYERYTYRQDRHPVKHKIVNDYDEPYSKRQKTEAYNRHRDDSARWYEIDSLDETLEQLQSQYTSCQSPDYITTDIMLGPIKEIMYTAKTKLEDPRVSSKKYVMKTDNEKVIFSTVVGRNVDMKAVDKTMWGIKEVAVPEALVQRPLENLIKEIYMDIDNPVSNTSIESRELTAELHLDSEYIPSKNYREDEVECIRKENLSEEKSENLIKIDTGSTQGLLYNYEIPKIKQCGKDSSLDHNAAKSLGVIEDYHTITDHDRNYNFTMDENKSSKNIAEPHDSYLCKNGNVGDNRENRLHDNECKNSRLISTREIVEGDLELSDETCDNTELRNHVVKKNVEDSTLNDKQRPSADTINREGVSCESNAENNGKDVTPKTPTEVNKNNIKIELDKKLSKDKPEYHSSGSKKHKEKKSKQKDTKTKETHNRFKESLESTCKTKTTEKKMKSKKEKPKEVKIKFRHLFGDSSSLITPEDLGLATVPGQVQTPPSTDYVPFFEDAVDVIDLKEITATVASNNPIDDDLPDDKTENKTNSETSKPSKTPKDSKKKLKKADDEKVATEVILTVNPIYENLNLEPVFKECDVVKTVVISTGVQPQLITENNTVTNPKPSEAADELVTDVRNQCDVPPNDQKLLIAALATSTPQKDSLQHTEQLSTESRIPESSCISNDRRAGSVDNVTGEKGYSVNTLDSQNETDAPDVRIYVRRRKRIIKRPPLT